MLGGKTKTELPMTLLLHSGDICIMSKESRLCYHAVPKILPCKKEAELSSSLKNEEEKDTSCCLSSFKTDESASDCENQTQNLSEFEDIVSNVNKNIQFVMSSLDYKPFQNYLNSARINMNIRQVLPPGFSSIPEASTKNEEFVPSENLCHEQNVKVNCFLSDENPSVEKKLKSDPS